MILSQHYKDIKSNNNKLLKFQFLYFGNEIYYLQHDQVYYALHFSVEFDAALIIMLRQVSSLGCLEPWDLADVPATLQKIFTWRVFVILVESAIRYLIWKPQGWRGQDFTNLSNFEIE